MPVSDEVDALDAAIDAVRGKHCCLVLDNCEHLLDAVSALAAAIRRDAPGVTLLTSQGTLKVADEHVYRLGTLAGPASMRARTSDAALRVRRRRAVRRARPGGRSALRADARNVRRGPRDLPPARRHRARARDWPRPACRCLAWKACGSPGRAL